jgi:hypothetical protein
MNFKFKCFFIIIMFLNFTFYHLPVNAATFVLYNWHTVYALKFLADFLGPENCWGQQNASFRERGRGWGRVGEGEGEGREGKGGGGGGGMHLAEYGQIQHFHSILPAP